MATYRWSGNVLTREDKVGTRKTFEVPDSEEALVNLVNRLRRGQDGKRLMAAYRQLVSQKRLTYERKLIEITERWMKAQEEYYERVCKFQGAEIRYKYRYFDPEKDQISLYVATPLKQGVPADRYYAYQVYDTDLVQGTPPNRPQEPFEKCPYEGYKQQTDADTQWATTHPFKTIEAERDELKKQYITMRTIERELGMADNIFMINNVCWQLLNFYYKMTGAARLVIRNKMANLVTTFMNSPQEFYPGATGYNLNFVFLGPPGTGKTTTAVALGKVLMSLGLLTGNMSGKDVVTISTKKDYTAEYIGQTAIKTDKLLNDNLEKVLILDEAYTFGIPSADTFSQEAVDTIVGWLDKHYNEICFIAAGYKDEMERGFFGLNTGLRRRFKHTWTLTRYTPDDLRELLLNFLKTDSAKLGLSGRLLSNEAGEFIVRVISYAPDDLFSGQAGDMYKLSSSIIQHFQGQGTVGPAAMKDIFREDITVRHRDNERLNKWLDAGAQEPFEASPTRETKLPIPQTPPGLQEAKQVLEAAKELETKYAELSKQQDERYHELVSELKTQRNRQRYLLNLLETGTITEEQKQQLQQAKTDEQELVNNINQFKQRVRQEQSKITTKYKELSRQAAQTSKQQEQKIQQVQQTVTRQAQRLKEVEDALKHVDIKGLKQIAKKFNVTLTETGTRRDIIEALLGVGVVVSIMGMLATYFKHKGIALRQAQIMDYLTRETS
uniref:AAA+ ATPase domain-containing protein n=1 Tax=viral metagenome TaxID=1070528 RepID=A0A6C0BMS2_9ZZZZ